MPSIRNIITGVVALVSTARLVHGQVQYSINPDTVDSATRGTTRQQETPDQCTDSLPRLLVPATDHTMPSDLPPGQGRDERRPDEQHLRP